MEINMNYNYTRLEADRYFASLNPITGEVDESLLEYYEVPVGTKKIKKDEEQDEETSLDCNL